MARGNKETSSNVFHLDRPADRLRFMLTFYLKTTRGLDASDPSPVFSMPRSEAIDQLLLQVPRGQDVTEDLILVLTRHHGNPISGEPDGLTRGWARKTAQRIHTVEGLSRRLDCYIDALDELDLPQQEEDGAEVVSMLAEPPSEPALLARRRRPTGPPSPTDLEQEQSYSEERHYFRRRLSEELNRCSRGNTQLSVLLVQANEIHEGSGAAIPLVVESIRRSLREYDILCRTARGELSVVLPGTSVADRERVIHRLRRVASIPSDIPIQVGFGAATWPEQGTRSDDLVQAAGGELTEDRHRQLQHADAAGPADDAIRDQPATVWFEGFPQEVKVQAVHTSQGLRLRLPLRFLRRGSSIQLGMEQDGSSSGVLTEAVLGRGSTTDTVPMLYVDVTPAAQ